MTVVLSVKPEWASLLISGLKTLEIRLTAPQPSFEVLLYVTKNGPDLTIDGVRANGFIVAKAHVEAVMLVWAVVDKDAPECWKYKSSEDMTDLLKNACLTGEQLREYGRRRTLWAWSISRIERIGFRSLEEYGLKQAPQSWCKAKTLNGVMNNAETD